MKNPWRTSPAIGAITMNDGITSTSEQARRRNYIVECEALRGLAILLVVLFHCSLRLDRASPITPTPLNAFALAGNTGVTLFFVLSGFLLNLPFMAGAPIRMGNFFLKRALRIMPLYACVVIAAAIFRDNYLAGLKSLFFLDTRISTLWPFGAVWWSLAVEVEFYLLLPFLHMAWRSPRWRWLLVPVLAIGIYLYYDISRAPRSEYYFIHSARDTLLALWPTFLCGAALAALHARHGKEIKEYCQHSRLLRNGGADIILAALTGLLAIILYRVAMFGYMNAYIQHFDHVVIEAATWTCIMGAILYLPSRLKMVLVNPAMIFLGLISYSLYLLHAPVVFFCLRILKGMGVYMAHMPLALDRAGAAIAHQPLDVKLAICIAAAIALSTLTYFAIEKPMLNFKSRIANPVRRRVQTS